MATPAVRTVAPAPYNDRYQTRAGSSVTPQLVTSVLQRADLGYMDRLADLLDEIRETDAHLQSVLFKREAQVAGAEWEVRPGADGGPKGKAKRAADYCSDVLQSLGGFSAALAHLQSGVFHGRAVLEILWTRDGGRWVPASLEAIHPRRIAFAAHSWRPYLWDASALDSPFNVFPGVALDSLNADAPKFIIHLPRVRGGYPTREGLGRTVLWPAIFKRFAVRDALALAEMAGRLGRIGKYAAGGDPKNPVRASPEDQDVLAQSLEAWSSAVSLVIPDTTSVEFKDPVTGNTIHMPLVEWANGEISKATLGETLTTEAGSRGARSLGQVHDDVRLMLARADGKAVAETLRRDLLAPMVRERFGDGVPVPEVAFLVDPEESLNDAAERLVKLVGAGLKVSQPFVRNLFGIEDPKDGEELLSVKNAEVVDGEPNPKDDAPTGDVKPPKDGKTAPDAAE